VIVPSDIDQSAELLRANQMVDPAMQERGRIAPRRAGAFYQALAEAGLRGAILAGALPEIFGDAHRALADEGALCSDRRLEGRRHRPGSGPDTNVPYRRSDDRSDRDDATWDILNAEAPERFRLW
jgi:hypothetical protein